MGAFDYDVSVGLYSGVGTKFRQKTLKYRRFERAAEAIRYVMEDIPASALLGCSIEIADETYVGRLFAHSMKAPIFLFPGVQRRLSARSCGKRQLRGDAA